MWQWNIHRPGFSYHVSTVTDSAPRTSTVSLSPGSSAARAGSSAATAAPASATAMTPDLAFNTAVSFTTNTNWQAYSGESAMSYLSQMWGLAVHNFTSAATGIALALAVSRAFAAGALDEGDADVAATASIAKAAASDTYLQTAIHAIQIHGGIGFTWDNDTHLWFKRAKASEVLFGDAHFHREQMLLHRAD